MKVLLRKRSAYLFVALAAFGCAHGIERPVDLYSPGRMEPQVREFVVISLPQIIPVGDTLRARVRRGRVSCLSDACSVFSQPRSDSAQWTVDSHTIATVTSEGLFVGKRPGLVRLTAHVPDTVLIAEIEVIPPVAIIAWEPAVERALVGDTIRLRAVARGPSGEVVTILPAWAVNGHYSYIERGGANGTVIVPSKAGFIELTALVGRDTAKLRIIVDKP